MNRAFLINLIFLLLINLLVKPFYLFGIDRVVQNTLQNDAYGIYFTLFNFTFLFQIVNDFGLQNFNNRLIAQQQGRLPDYLPLMLRLKSGLALAYLLLVLGVGLLLGYVQDYPLLLGLLAVNQIMLSLILYLRTNISGLAEYRLDSFLSVLDRLLLILLLLPILYGGWFREQFSVYWFAGAQTLSLLLTALITLLLVLRRAGRLRIGLRWSRMYVVLRQSIPYALVVFLMTLYTRIDGVMVERLLPDEKAEADLYASAYRLLDASNMLGYLFASLLLPMFARLLAERADLRPLLRFSVQLILAGTLTLAIATAVYAVPIMQSLYASGSEYSAGILRYLILSFVGMGLTYIYGTLLTANGNLSALNRIFIIGVVLNVLLNLVLIGPYGARGAALATLVTQVAVALAQLGLAIRTFSLQFRWRMLGRIGLFAVLLLLVQAWLSPKIPVPWYGQYLFSLLAGLPLAVGMGLLHWKAALQLLRSRQSG